MSKKLTRELIVQKIRSDRLGSIKNLNLWGTNLEDISLIQEMPSLEIVSLSVNKIRSLKAFSGLPNLRELYLRKNMICDLNEIKYLTDCENLKILWLSENPICDNPNYRKIVISVLPQLVKFDDIIITEEERKNADKILLQGNNNVSDYEDENIDNFDNYNNDNIRNNRRSSQEKNINRNKNDNYNQGFNDNYNDLSQSHQVKKTPTYQSNQNRFNDELTRDDDNIGFKRNQSNKLPKNDIYDNEDDIYNNYNNNKYRERDYNEYSNNNNRNNNKKEKRNDIRNENRNDNRNDNRSNILNCVLLLLKELNRNELNVVKREIDRQNNNNDFY